MTVTPPLQHPRYRCDRWIAAGGMGEVWAATDTSLDRPVAVKVLRPECAEDPVFRARFEAEARHAAALQHPHVASVFDYGEAPVEGRSPLPFLVMELVDGRPLSALLADGQPLAPEVAADLVAQAADGVAAAHRLGIVHRDVKPGNLLVTAEGQVKVTDFGVARALDAAPLTLTGHLVGTPHYLSPEQARGDAATGASDIYALGIVLYECLTGRRPFVGDTAVATALMHIRDPLPAFPDSVPPRLQQITRTATAKEPGERYESMAALAAALRDESAPTAVLAPPPTRSVPRSGVLGLLVLLLIAGVAAWGVSRLGDGPAEPTPTATSASASAQDDRVRVQAADYVGMPVEEAARRLDDRGFVVRTRVRPNPGTGTAGTVAAVGPTGLLKQGARVELTAWGPPPVPEPVAPEDDGSGGDGDDDGQSDGGNSGQGNSGDSGQGNDKGKSGQGSDKGSDKGGKKQR